METLGYGLLGRALILKEDVLLYLVSHKSLLGNSKPILQCFCCTF